MPDVYKNALRIIVNFPLSMKAREGCKHLMKRVGISCAEVPVDVPSEKVLKCMIYGITSLLRMK